MYGVYKQIKETIDPQKPIYMTKADENWGLCCNAIHMIDIFMYLTEESTYTIETKWLDQEIEGSKRDGYIEMTGMLKISTPEGHELTLISENNFDGVKTMMIENNNNMYVISEGGGSWTLNNERYSFEMPFQSQLTGILADELLITGGCSLTPFDMSVNYHKPFIEALLSTYNELTDDSNNKLLPIT